MRDTMDTVTANMQSYKSQVVQATWIFIGKSSWVLTDIGSLWYDDRCRAREGVWRVEHFNN